MTFNTSNQSLPTVANTGEVNIFTGAGLTSVLTFNVYGYDMSGGDIELLISSSVGNFLVTSSTPGVTVTSNKIEIQITPALNGGFPFSSLPVGVKMGYHLDALVGTARTWRVQGDWKIIDDVGDIPGGVNDSFNVKVSPNISVEVSLSGVNASLASLVANDSSVDGDTVKDALETNATAVNTAVTTASNAATAAFDARQAADQAVTDAAQAITDAAAAQATADANTAAMADMPTINRTDDPTGPIKFAIVAALPGSPDADTIYFIT